MQNPAAGRKPRFAAIDIASYIVLAASIGLAVSITLGGVVMLLAQAGESAPAPRAATLSVDAVSGAALERSPVPLGQDDRP